MLFGKGSVYKELLKYKYSNLLINRFEYTELIININLFL